MKIFFTRRHTAADVPLGFVHIQNLAHLRCQRWINCKKSLCYILVYSTLTDSKLPGRLADRSLMFNDIIGDLQYILSYKTPA